MNKTAPDILTTRKSLVEKRLVKLSIADDNELGKVLTKQYEGFTDKFGYANSENFGYGWQHAFREKSYLNTHLHGGESIKLTASPEWEPEEFEVMTYIPND